MMSFVGNKCQKPKLNVYVQGGDLKLLRIERSRLRDYIHIRHPSLLPVSRWDLLASDGNPATNTQGAVVQLERDQTRPNTRHSRWIISFAIEIDEAFELVSFVIRSLLYPRSRFAIKSHKLGVSIKKQ